MKAIKLLTILTLLIFFIGCNKQKGQQRKYGLRFNTECTIPHGKPALESLMGNSIHIIDTLLLVQYQHHNPSYFWEVYNLDVKHLKSILRRGRGPNEVLFADYAGQYEIVDGEKWMFFFDMNSAKFYKINLDKSILSGKDVLELVAPIAPEKSPYFAIANNAFLYRDYNRDNRSVNIVRSDKSLKNPTIIKKIYQDIAFDDYPKLGHSLYYNKKNNKVCVVPYYVNHIQIIDIEGDDDVVLSTDSSDNWQSVRQKEISESTMIYYTNIRTTDDYIFAIYNNKKISEMANAQKKVEIHVFTWEGDAVAKIRFDDYLTSFAVDKNNKILYGLDNTGQLYIYDINSCLNGIQ